MCVSVCLSACLSVCPYFCSEHISRTSQWITMIFGMWVCVGKTKVKVNFGPLVCDLGTAAEIRFFLNLLNWMCYDLAFWMVDSV